jgi:pimeloyl-ACP methyl ester carboxylesterase
MVGLLAYACAYSLWARSRWPALGRKLPVGSTVLHIDSRGAAAGLPVVALHGATANSREWLGPLEHSLSAEFRLHLVDRPGFGHSGRPPGAERLGVAAATLARGLEQVGTGPAVILAHSLGAATALRLALDRPDLVAGLVLVAPASHPYPGPNAWFVRAAARPITGRLFCWLLVPAAGPAMSKAAMRNVFAPAPVPEGYRLRAGLGLLFQPWSFRANALDVSATRTEFAAQAPFYCEITVPTAILTSDADRVVSPKIHARALITALPQAQLIELPGTGHMPHQLAPAAVADAVRQIWTMARGQTAV